MEEDVSEEDSSLEDGSTEDSALEISLEEEDIALLSELDRLSSLLVEEIGSLPWLEEDEFWVEV